MEKEWKNAHLSSLLPPGSISTAFGFPSIWKTHLVSNKSKGRQQGESVPYECLFFYSCSEEDPPMAFEAARDSCHKNSVSLIQKQPNDSCACMAESGQWNGRMSFWMRPNVCNPQQRDRERGDNQYSSSIDRLMIAFQISRSSGNFSDCL